MILSDRSIREEIAAGRIVIDPFEDDHVQPSSVDLRIDRFFRVFRNHTMGYIDVKKDQQELTELVEIAEDDVFILHPGEFVLGSTLERVALPNDLVARLEGKSSLGRLGLLIHSSLPGSEKVLFLDEAGLRLRRIDELVNKRVEGSVAAYDPQTLETGYFPVTGWFEGAPDRIYEVVLASGRSVRVTAGHNLFTLDPGGEIRKLRAQELVEDTLVAVPRALPDPAAPVAAFDLRQLVPEALLSEMIVEGPTVGQAHGDEVVRALLREAAPADAARYRATGTLPADVARLAATVWSALGRDDSLRPLGSKYGLPVVWDVDEDLAWLIGFYVASGHQERTDVVFSNTERAPLDRVEAILGRLGLPRRRRSRSVTCAATCFSSFLEWIGTGTRAASKRLPSAALGWPATLLEALLEGLLDGGTQGASPRRCCRSSSAGLVNDLLYLAPRLGRGETASCRVHEGGHFQVSFPSFDDTLQSEVPLPEQLLLAARERAGLSQGELARLLAVEPAASTSGLESPSAGRDAVRLGTLRHLASCCRQLDPGSRESRTLSQLVDGGVGWDRVVRVVDTDEVQPVYDLEVRPAGRRIENFVAGSGGVFVSNTAGFVDASFDGHLTLELSNVATLPITLYPGMKIGQISFLRMTTEADHPYGSKEAGSKYQHQRGPTPSRYFENFSADADSTVDSG